MSGCPSSFGTLPNLELPYTPGMPDLEAAEARIWSLLDPYRRELESATIYGMPSLRWPGAKAHDYFAAVRAGKNP